MKKYLILLVTLLTSLIFCVSNVSAANGSFTQNNYAIVNTYNATIEQVQDHLKNYPVLNNNSFISILQRARELIENNKISDYYMLLYRNESSPYAFLIFFNEENVIRDNYTVFSKSIYGNYPTNFYFKTNTKITGYYVYPTYSKVSNSMDMGAATADGTSNLYYETNYSFDYHYSNNSAYDTFFANGIGYKNGDFVFNTMTGLNSIELAPTEPKLQYKTGFTSSEAYSVLGKVSVEFLETDTNIYKYKKSQFKLQFGSNDFSKENIPIFSHYKVYGKRNDTWTELSEEDLKMPYDQDINGNIIYDDRNLITVDTTYDYSEGMLADASITLEINYDYLVDLDTTNPIWTDWKIEFYFDNTNNGYIYVYDTLAESTWNDTAKIFNDYLFYYFPPGYRYAFISSEETSSIGRIYFPSNHYVSQLVRLKGFYYHYSINWIADELVRNISEEDTYYSYFDFNFSYSDKRCVALSRKLGSLYTGYYDPNFLSNYLKPFPDEWLIFNSEISYFYAPIGMKVTFSKEMLDDIIIYTPDGTIKNDSSTIYDTTDYDIWDDYDNVDDMFSHLTNFFQESIPYMKPLIDLFVDFYNSLNEYVKAFIEFFAIFLLICAVILWLDRRSDS